LNPHFCFYTALFIIAKYAGKWEEVPAGGSLGFATTLGNCDERYRTSSQTCPSTATLQYPEGAHFPSYQLA
jgi:hypothetical protein